MGMVIIQLKVYWFLEGNNEQNTWHLHYSGEIESIKESASSSQIRSGVPVTTLSFDSVNSKMLFK